MGVSSASKSENFMEHLEMLHNTISRIGGTLAMILARRRLPKDYLATLRQVLGEAIILVKKLEEDVGNTRS